MSILKRVKDVVRQNLSDKPLPPEERLDRAVEELDKRYRISRKAVSSALADTKRLELKLAGYDEQIKSWTERAGDALDADDEDLARLALEKKVALEAESAAVREVYVKQKAGTDTLKASLDELKKLLEKTRRERNLLLARKQAAKAKQTVGDASSGLGGVDVELDLDALLEEVEGLEAEADVAVALPTALNPEEELEAKFAKMDQEKKLDSELAKLKASRSSNGQTDAG